MNTEVILKSLEVLWKGMLTIFVGIATIYIIILVLSDFDAIKKIFTKRIKN